MIEKLKTKVKEIYNAKNKVIEPKKNLILTIITAVCVIAVLGGIYFLTGDIKYIVVAVIAMVPLIFYAIYAFFKEKRQDKSSQKDKQEFLSGAKYRQKEWKTAYYQYKKKHSFEVISQKGMKHDLERRYRKKDFGYIRVGLLLIIGSILILSISMTEANQNFSKVARLVDDNGSAIILKNNKPRYLIIDFDISDSMQTASKESVSEISKRLIKQNRKAYEELAK